jgi:hypothetical protein
LSESSALALERFLGEATNPNRARGLTDSRNRNEDDVVAVVAVVVVVVVSSLNLRQCEGVVGGLSGEDEKVRLDVFRSIGGFAVGGIRIVCDGVGSG